MNICSTPGPAATVSISQYELLYRLPGVVIPLIDPDLLNLTIQAAARKGETMFPSFRLTVAVGAGSEVTFPFNLPQNFVCTKRTPLEFTSDFYDPNLIVNVYVDDNDLVTPYGMSLTGPAVVDFGEYYVKWRNVIMVFTNNTATDANITFQVQASMMHISLYEEWYRPIVKFTLDRLSDISEMMGGRRI